MTKRTSTSGQAAKETESLDEILRKIYERIHLRAYELYEQRARQDGHALDDWLQAEAELTQAKKKVFAA